MTIQYTKMGGADGPTKQEIVTAGKKIVPFIPTQFDEYYHFYNEDQRYKIKTYNDGSVDARSSFRLMPKEIDWTNDTLYNLVSKYYIPSEVKKGDELYQ